MRTICLLLISEFFLLPSYSQTYNIFKSDTINRTDGKGLKQGVWRKYYQTDSLFSEGVYKNGKRIGMFRTFHKNGKPQSVLRFRGSSEVSDGELWYDTGILMAKGKYIGKEKDSLWTYFDEEGNKNAEEFYNKGKKEGTWKIFHRNGQVSRVMIYKSGKCTGPYTEYFDSGKPKIEGTMVNGEFDGKVTIYHPNGQTWQSGIYRNGLREGKWVTKKEDGTLEKEDEYKAGAPLNPREE